MLILVTYDVSVLSKAGQKRLRQIAKVCLDFGVRVQNSVFECEVAPEQYVELRTALEAIYNPKEDSLRFYHLGKKGNEKVEHLGCKVVANPLHDVLIL